MNMQENLKKKKGGGEPPLRGPPRASVIYSVTVMHVRGASHEGEPLTAPSDLLAVVLSEEQQKI